MSERNDDHDTLINSDDETLLAVKGSFETKEEARDYVKSLAKAVLVVYYKHNQVNLRCIGGASVNNGVKACIIAIGEARKKGLELIPIPSFTTIDFNGQERTAIVLNVVSR